MQEVVRALEGRLVNDAQLTMRNMQKRRLHHLLATLDADIAAARAKNPPPFDRDEIWKQMAMATEFALGVAGIRVSAYVAVFFGFEYFMGRCVALVKGDTEYRVPRNDQFIVDVQSCFGDEICIATIKDRRVDLARLIRNALAHNGRKIPDALRSRVKEFCIDVDADQIVITPDCVRNLYTLLQDRVDRVIAKTLGKLKSATDY